MSYNPFLWQSNGITNDLHIYQLVEEINFSNNYPGDFSVVVDDPMAEYRVVADLYNHSSSVIGLRLNNDSGSNYTRRDIRANNGTISNASDTLNYIFLNYSSTLQNCMDLKIFCNNTSPNYKNCVGLLRNDGFVGSASYTWANSVDAVTSLDFSRVTGTGNFTGYIRVYKLVKTQILKQQNQPIELVHSQDYSNASVSINLDISDCDSIEIETSTTSLSSDLKLVLDNDTGANYVRQYLNAESTTPVTGETNAIYVYLASLASPKGFYKTSYSRFNKLFVDHAIYFNTNTSIMQNGYRYIGAQPGNSIQITGTGVTGKIKIWKRY